MASTLLRSVPSKPDRDPRKHFEFSRSWPFLAIQSIGAGGLVWAVWNQRWDLLIWAVVLWRLRMFFMTGVYHRYFGHRSYRLTPRMEFVFGLLGTTAAQKGPVWWAGWHRVHHKYSDKPEDVHSPQDGFWWSHIGWISSPLFADTRWDLMKDFDRPGMRWIERYNWVGPWVLGTVCFFGVGLVHAGAGFGGFIVGGIEGLLVVFFASTFLLWHSTFIVNSLSHVFGRRPYKNTHDTSRNSTIIAVITDGEGFHNNHHRHPQSARQGFRWWQIDVTFYNLWLLSKLGIVKDLRPVPRHIIDEAKLSKRQQPIAA